MVRSMKFWALGLFISFANFALAQTWEIGTQIGVSNYLGDLAPSVSLREFNPSAGAFLKKNYSGYFSLVGKLSYFRVSGDDANFSQNQYRNLNFRSNVLEASFQYEFNFQKYLIGLRAKTFSPYISVGIGAFYFNPEGELDGRWHSLRPLSTEGQGIGGAKSYSNFAVSLPMGGGVKWQIAKRWNTSAFVSFRYTFTDYLDDVSTTYFNTDAIASAKGDLASQLADKSVNSLNTQGQERGNPGNNDWFFFSGISLSYLLKDPDCPPPY